MAFLRKVLLIGFTINSYIALSQNSIYVKGYVINDSNILPDVTVSVAKKNISTNTNFKGHFKIQCSIGDTLIFENKYTNYKIEKYCVKDSSLLIVKLVQNVKLDYKGDRKPFAYAYASKLITKNTFTFSGSITDGNIYSCGYSYYPDPFFPDEPFLPIMNNVSLGLSISKYNNSYYLFPNFGLPIRNFYKDIFNSNVTFSFFVPSVKIGYWSENFEARRNGFGYELGVTLANFNISQKHLSVELNYNSYLTNSGAFMISLNLNLLTNPDRIPWFIKKQISK